MIENLYHIATIIAANEGYKTEFVSLLGHSYNKKENNFGNSQNIKIKSIRYGQILKALSLGYIITKVRIESNNVDQVNTPISVTMKSIDGREVSYPGVALPFRQSINIADTDALIYVN